MTARLVVLVSGNGTNLQAVIDACGAEQRDGSVLDAKVVAVISNRPDAFGLQRASNADIAAITVPVDGRSRAIYDGVLAHVVTEHEPTLVVLAGWMRLLSNPFLNRFPVINLHPALPGTYPGLQAPERAFAAWQAGEISHGGVMVHWVPDAGVDDGPVIDQEVVPFEEGDTLESFEGRLHQVEHRLLVSSISKALQQLSTGAA